MLLPEYSDLSLAGAEHIMAMAMTWDCPSDKVIWRSCLVLVGLAFALQFTVILSVTFPSQHDTPAPWHATSWRHGI